VDELKRIAAKLDKLPSAPHARMTYDLYAGGLAWSDEAPADWEECIREDGSPAFVGLGEFRALVNYRSSLIQGTPREEFHDLWTRALQLCPNWPGFLPQRRDPALAPMLHARSDASRRSWEEIDARFNESHPAQARTNA
jgi:hypothetical protein